MLISCLLEHFWALPHGCGFLLRLPAASLIPIRVWSGFWLDAAVGDTTGAGTLQPIANPPDRSAVQPERCKNAQTCCPMRGRAAVALDVGPPRGMLARRHGVR